MTLRSFTLTFTGSAQNLGALLTGGILDSKVYCIDIQADPANTAVFYVGGPDVTADNGIQIPIPDNDIPEPPYRVGDAATSDMAMRDVYVLGTLNEKARILVFA